MVARPTVEKWSEGGANEAHKKTTHHETAQAQNGPSQIGPSSKRPKLKTAHGTERPMAQNDPHGSTGV
jgi:hypothetical protein